jgi:hypothetical protein
MKKLEIDSNKVSDWLKKQSGIQNLNSILWMAVKIGLKKGHKGEKIR